MFPDPISSPTGTNIDGHYSAVWDCHGHKNELCISNQFTIYHPEQGQLSYYDLNHDSIIFFPIIFKSKAAAQNWIDTGTIAELQEGLNTLRVTFAKQSLIKRASWIPQLED